MTTPIDAETAFQRWLSPGPGVKNYPRAYTDWCAQARAEWEAKHPRRVAWTRSQDWSRVRYVSSTGPQWGMGD